MSDNIQNMDFKKLRNEVQLLRDELAIMKRKYEDILYNLDDDNFSSTFLKEKDKMKPEISVTAEGIKTKVSKDDLNDALSAYSTIEQTAEQISTEVAKEYSSLDSRISIINQTANSISTKVGQIENGQFGEYSLFTQTADGFTFDGEKTTFTGVVYLADEEILERKYSLFYTTSRGFEEVLLHSCAGYNIPLVLGDEDCNVYVGWKGVGNEVATRSWVLANGGSGGTAVFG